MPTITHVDYLLQVSGTGLVAVPGVWVRLLNNSTATNYYSTAVTTSTGAFTHSAVPGDYSAFYGTAATVPGTPTLANAHWAVPVTAGDDAVLGSATLVVSSPYVPTAPTGGAALGSGDNQEWYAVFGSGVTTAGQVERELLGTTASPDLSPHPGFKITRIHKLLAAQVFGDGAAQAAALSAGCVVDVAATVQGIGLFGWAQTKSNQAYPLGADAVGVYGTGAATTGSTRAGIGGFFGGYAKAAGNYASAAQFNVENDTGVNHSVVSGSTALTQGLYLTASGTNRVGAAFEIHSGGQQFETGIYFGNRVDGAAHTGPTVTADIRSDSLATTSIQINGTHTSAIDIAAGAGGIAVHGALNQFTSTAALGGELRLIDSVSGKNFGFTVSATSLAISEVGVADRLYIGVGGGITIPNGGLIVSLGGLDVIGGARLRALGAFVAADKYVVADSNGNLHLSALGPAS